jgi:hypothetical protein
VFQQRNKLQSTITIGDARDVITDKQEKTADKDVIDDDQRQPVATSSKKFWVDGRKQVKLKVHSCEKKLFKTNISFELTRVEKGIPISGCSWWMTSHTGLFRGKKNSLGVSLKNVRTSSLSIWK